jgi:DNA helicase-2/ATP-dependent DNA helicase PcrA
VEAEVVSTQDEPRSGRDVARDLLRGLDAEQLLAVTTDAAPLAIIAAAGSGKTTVLTRRIARRIADGTADANRVLALTFTRDAAAEMRRRLRRLDVRERIECGTFHAVALRLLRDRAVAEGTAAPVVAQDRIRLLKEVLTETRVGIDPYSAQTDIDWARARLVHPRDFGAANRAERRRSNLTADTFPLVMERYAAIKRRRGVVDFDDLLVDVLELIRRDATFRDIVRWRFRHLFVDEAQDLNPLQHALLEEVRGGRNDICLVGDHRQAIYGWNGADPSTLVDVEERFRGVTVVALTGNYRCSPQIVRAGAAALSGAGMTDDTASRRSDGRSVRFVASTDEHGEAVTIATVAADLVQRHGPRRVAVLTRTNDQLNEIGRALEAAGLPIERSAGRSPLDRAVAEANRCTNREQLGLLAETIWESEAGDPVRLRVAEEIDRFLSSGESGGFRAWVEARQPFDDLDPDDGEGAISLVTFHAAKGREWSGVVVAGVEEGLVPHFSSKTRAQHEEEARLLYVALTRASEELVVTWATERRGLPTAESPLLAAVRTTTLADAPQPPPAAMGAVKRPVDPLAPLREWRTAVARAGGVVDHAVCSDATLRGLIERPPADAADVAVRLGLSPSAAERMAPKLLSLLDARAPA